MKKNGFTLIELLAIIVILAIIAVITVPIMLNIIDNSRRGAAVDSALGYKESINKYYVGKMSENSDYTIPDGTYTVDETTGYLTLEGSDVTLDVQVSGTLPSSGSLTYSKNTLTGGCLVMGDYAVTFNDDRTTSVEKGECYTIKPLDVNLTTWLTGDGDQIAMRVDITNIEDKPETVTYKYYSDDELMETSTNNTYTLQGEFWESYVIRVEVLDINGNILGSVEKTEGTNCFVAGTQVLTENGMKNIEDIKVGEKVYALNIDNNQKELKEVLSTYEGKTSRTYELTMGNEKIITTKKHKFYIVDKGWTRTYKLSIGDKIVAKDNSNLEITDIKLVKHEEPVNVYNLEVDDYHTYLITNSEILVHNAGSPNK